MKERFIQWAVFLLMLWLITLPFPLKAHADYWVLEVYDDGKRENVFLKPFDRQLFCWEAKESIDQYNAALQLKHVVSCTELQ